MFGTLYDFKKAYIAAVLTTTGFVFHYIPMFILGMEGMPRRYYDYLPKYQSGNFLAGIGGFIMVGGIILMFVNLLHSFRKPCPVSDDPWGGTTLEWTVPSPPPLHNFINTPVIPAFPYDFSQVINHDECNSGS
jgi:cytochrome c oxidase subunit 1